MFRPSHETTVSFRTSHSIRKLINNGDEKTKKGFIARVEKLKKQYAEMSKVYQKSKRDTDIPLSDRRM